MTKAVKKNKNKSNPGETMNHLTLANDSLLECSSIKNEAGTDFSIEYTVIKWMVM